MSEMFATSYHMLFTVLIFWQVVFPPSTVNSAYISEITCPQLCQCLDKDVGCNNLNLTRLPNDIDVSTEKLELAENKLSAESLGLKLQFYTNLKTLDLRDNFITVITKELLQGLETSLVSLDLSGNGIRRVEKNTLSSLKSLRYLKLSRNDLNGIPELPENLEMLDLSENVKISALKVTSLLGLRKLRHLIINDCSIYTIEENCFTEQEILSDLQLNGNSLYQIPLKLPPTLTSMSLQDNRIRTIGAEIGFRDPFTNLSRLQNLYLQRNWIKDISGGAFKSLSSLRELDLSINRLEVIPSKLPKGLMRLNLGGNLLTHISSDYGYISANNNPFSEMSFLERLALNNNSLSSLPSKLLQKNYWLTSLDLSDNEFDTIPNLHTEAKLEMNLDGNKIQEIQMNSFNNCPRIVKLYLNSNQISRIARTGLSTLKELRTLEMRGNSLIDLPLLDNRRLTNIDLSFNIIQTVTPATFNLTKQLTKLNLENNELSVLEESVFENLRNLKYLFLANNKIIEINFFIPPSVMELQLHHNQIATIGNLTSSFFSTDSFLTALDLSSNNIRSISKFAFSQFQFLTDIYLDANKLSALKLDFPPSAKRISLAKNVIKKLESSAITGLTHAHFVDFSGNRISLIEKDFFSAEEFQLRSDQNVNRPFEVNLENNYLQTINRKVLSPILDSQIQLSLAISENPIRCNCLWSWLSDELSQPYLEISGDCYYPTALRKQEISHIPKEKFACVKPKIRSVAKNMKLVTTIGATATLECVADGEPVPIYTWAIHSSNGNDLITLINDEVYDEHFYVLLNGTLVIYDVRPSDSQLIYACVANNYVGYDTLSIKLVIDSSNQHRTNSYEVWETSTQFPPSITPKINLIANESTTQNYDRISFDLSQGTSRVYPWKTTDSTPTTTNVYNLKPRPVFPGEYKIPGIPSDSSIIITPPINAVTNRGEGKGMQIGGEIPTQMTLSSVSTIIAIICGFVAIFVVMVLIVTIYALLKRKKTNYIPHQNTIAVPINGIHKKPNDEQHSRAYGVTENGRAHIEHHDTSEYMFISAQNTETCLLDCGNESPLDFYPGSGENVSSQSNAETPTDSVAGSTVCTEGGTRGGGAVLVLNNNSRSCSGSLHHVTKLKVMQPAARESPDNGVRQNSKRSHSDDNFQPYSNKQSLLEHPINNFDFVAEKPELIEFCDRESVV